MLPIVCVVCLVVGGALGSPQANQYIDTVLNNALPNELRMFNIDPTPLPNFTTNFTDKVVLIGKVKGKADYTQGNLTGLSGIRRYAECQGPYNSFGARSINCTLSLNTMKIKHFGKVKYGKMPSVNMKAKANVTSTLIFVEVTSQPNLQTSMRNFMFQQIGQVNVRFTGLGPLNRFMGVLEDGYKREVPAQVFNAITQRLQYALNRAVMMIPLPN